MKSDWYGSSVCSLSNILHSIIIIAIADSWKLQGVSMSRSDRFFDRRIAALMTAMNDASAGRMFVSRMRPHPRNMSFRNTTSMSHEQTMMFKSRSGAQRERLCISA